MKKENVYTYNIEFLEFAFSYLNNYEILDININNLNKFSPKEKHVLTKLKELYHKVKLLKDYQTIQLEHFSDEEILCRANKFLIELFPNLEKEILELDNLISFNEYSIYEAGVNYRLNKNKVICDKIIIPTDGTNYTSSIIVHEKVHVLAFDNIDLKELFINKIELFPMFIQRIMLNKTNDYFGSILDRVIRINDTKENFNHLDLMNYLNNNPNKTELDECVCKYLNVRGYDYLISELYSDLLFKYYLIDSEKMVKRINQVFDRKISIENFLNNYNINLLNKDLIPIIKEETNKCKRISIIP